MFEIFNSIEEYKTYINEQVKLHQKTLVDSDTQIKIEFRTAFPVIVKIPSESYRSKTYKEVIQCRIFSHAGIVQPVTTWGNVIEYYPEQDLNDYVDCPDCVEHFESYSHANGNDENHRGSWSMRSVSKTDKRIESCSKCGEVDPPELNHGKCLRCKGKRLVLASSIEMADIGV